MSANGFVIVVVVGGIMVVVEVEEEADKQAAVEKIWSTRRARERRRSV
jgi:hypothetical protein